MKKKTLLTPAQVRGFRKKIYDYYRSHGRDLPWRKTKNPYRILLSEIMLQQTQVERVLVKYKEFLAAFPNFGALAEASLPEVLRIWSGMGYNRRALALKALAEKVVNDHSGKLPDDPEKLSALPGIGKYTAGAVLAFAFNQPVVFLDTNIRRVYIHEFFHDQEKIHDDEIKPLIERTMDRKNPRKWYNALMDYGAMLKREQENPNRRSAHYTRQSPFQNSNRRIRGMILKTLVLGPPLTEVQISRTISAERERVKKNLTQLRKEGFIIKRGNRFTVQGKA